MAQVTLNTFEGAVCRVTTGRALQALAMRWNYIVRQRHRWSRRTQASQNVANRAAKELAEIGVREKHLRQLAKAGIVEVRIPFETEADGWEARICPWEYMLSAATGPYRADESMAVVRHLETGKRGSRRAPKTLAIVEAAPGELREFFDFEAERNLVRSSLPGLVFDKAGSIVDPTPARLRERLKQLAADVLHITGIDAHQAARLLEDERLGNRDGLCLTGTRNEVEPVDAEALAALLTAGDPPPRFIGFNCWDSGARIAPLAVARGAAAALGFQHTFDDSVAELFFVNFYRAWAEHDWDLLAAFTQAWEAIASFRERIRGSSIILWSAAPLVRREKTYRGMPASREGIREVRRSHRERRTSLEARTRHADPRLDQIRDLVDVEVEPITQINYSMLHNGRSLLNKLVFRFKPPVVAGSTANEAAERAAERDLDANNAAEADESQKPVSHVNDLEVEILLNVGADSFPYKTKLGVGVDEEWIDLADPLFKPMRRGNPAGGIRVPLTSELARSVDERMQTSLLVDIRWHDQLLYRHTHAVYLLPVDEWRLDDLDICWLPSFVQPRDPAVSTIVASAQRYLMCLADAGAAGFDGYQAFDAEADDPWEGVERQVKAIWSALVLDHRLHYINPPPAYSQSAQRLRTPRQVLQQRRGTCVDLAILMASCLEWIEVYPVVFLLDDHAFPGYWRSLDAYNAYCGVEADDEADVAALSGEEPPTGGDRTPQWIANRSAYRELRRYVQSGELVPLETVCLTEPTGFHEAVEAAQRYFATAHNRSFHSMVDIPGARESVTPLPVVAND